MEAVHKPASVGRRLAAVRSLFAFAHRIGYLQWNVAAAVTTPPIEDKLSQRILTEDQTAKLIVETRISNRRGPVNGKQTTMGQHGPRSR
jgi:integrase/recombinase XerD